MKKPSKRWLSILKKVGITLLLVVLALSFFVTFFLKEIVNNQLKNQVSQTFGDFYTLSFEKSSTSLSTTGFNIEFQQVVFESDTANQFMLSRYPALFFKTNTLRINDINIFDLFLNATINVNRVSIDKPKLLFFIPRNEQAEQIEKAKTPSSTNENSIQSIRVGKFNLSEGEASFVFHRNFNDTLYAGKNVHVEMEGLGLDLVSSESVVKTATVRELKFSLKDLLLKPKELDYAYKIAGIQFDYTGELLLCYGMEVISNGNPSKMALNSKFRKTIFNVKMDTMVYESNNFKALKDLERIEARSLKLINLKMVLDRNKDVPLDETRYKKLFHQSLLDLPIIVDVDSVKIQNASIDYRVHSKKEQQPGNLLLTNLNGNITQLHTEENKKGIVNADFEGTFMGDGPFTFAAKLPLKNPRNHTYKGHIGAMDFTSLNPLIANLTSIKMEKGRIVSMEFEGNADHLTNNGVMKIQYRNLKLKITDKQNNSRWLQSGVGNLLIRNKNRTADGLPDTTLFSFKRPPYKDHLTLYGDGLINGFAKSILPKTIYNLLLSN